MVREGKSSTMTLGKPVGKLSKTLQKTLGNHRRALRGNF
jgi:hypothetical protein